MEDQVEVIKSNKGGMKVIHKGYMYTVHKKRQCGGIRWRCAQRSLHCKGSISTGVDGPPKVNMPHNHLPDLHSVALARGRQAEDFTPVTQFLHLKFEEDPDSMPLQDRLSKVAAQEKIAAGATGQILKSQPLSPTKLKVTRQGPKAPKLVEPPQSPVNEEMCLRWNSHHSNMQTAFPNILSKEQYVDVTLAAEGKTLKCHRLILSSCSPYFDEILSGISPFQHPVLFMKDIPFWILKSLCDFMYAGEVHIFQNKLEELLTVAEALKIKGLAGKSTPPENRDEPSHKSENPNNNNNNREKKKHQHDKEKLQHQQHQQLPPPLKKNPVFTQTNNFESTSHDYDDDLLDPLDLLEPLYEEVAEEKKPSTVVKPKENKYHYQTVKKPFARRLRKRKYSEQREPREPSPPPVFSFRKGTRSRPNVKIPKYYHTDYTNPSKPALNAQTDPLLDVDEIKTEPIDVEDNLIGYSDQEEHYIENSLEPTNCDSSIQVTGTKPSLSPQQADKFKKIKLTKPIITEVHTIEETNTTSGGLEVIKITVQQPEEAEKKEQGGALLQEESVAETPMEESVVEAQMEEGVAETVMEESGVEAEAGLQSEEHMPQEETDNVDGNVQEMTVAENEVEEMEGVIEQETEEVASRREDVEVAEIRIADVRSTCLDEEEGEEKQRELPALVALGEQRQQEEGQREQEEEQREQEEEQREQEEEQREQEEEQRQQEEEIRSSLNHLEKEAMNVANAINMESQAGPPDIE